METHKNKKFNQLPEIVVSWKKLLLDPNNPRLHSSTEPEISLAGPKGLKIAIEEQDFLQSKMTNYDISDLTVPMKEKGFIYRGIPAVLVKRHDDWDEDFYLTLEGNRRLTAVRHLMNEDSITLDEAVINSFENIKVIDCSSLTTEEIEEYLGMIHIGGTKPWDLMPKAKYLFSQFIRELCRENGLPITEKRFEHEFINRSFDNLLDVTGKRALKKVADLSSVKQGDVKKSIAIFRMFIQVNKHLEDIEAKKMDTSKASLLEETFGSTKLREHFEVDEKNLIFSESGLEKWVDACCDTPDNLGHLEDEKKGAVIKQASAGPSNLRDLRSIITKDWTPNKQYISAVLKERRKAQEVLGDLQSVLNKETLAIILDTIKKQFDKIELGQLDQEWSDQAQHLFKEIKFKFEQIEGAANKK